MSLPNYLRATALFYRTVVPFTLVASLLVLLMLLPFGGLRWPSTLLLCKLATFPLVWYLTQQLRPHQYWLYLNLSVRPWQLWLAVGALDTLGFWALLAALSQDAV